MCRILWPDGETRSYRTDAGLRESIEATIGPYRPGPLRTVDAFIDGEKVSR